MKRTVITLSSICVFLLVASSSRPVKVAAQTQTRCLAYIPADWGTYKGASESYGLAFEDFQGTLRFISQVSCSGVSPVPTAALELKRK